MFIIKKIITENLVMITTNACNLKCKHCLRGECSNEKMSDTVVKATLDQFKCIGNLAISGGEPLLAIDRIEKIFSYIVDKKISVKDLTVVTNGTIYSEEFIRLLDYFEKYVKYEDEQSSCSLAVSFDSYHLEEIERLQLRKQFLENLQKYRESKFFSDVQEVIGKLWREGRAQSIHPNATVPLKPMQPIMTYIDEEGKFDIRGTCKVGPIVTVNTNGTITECEASYEHQEAKYDYGNVLIDSVENVWVRRRALVLPPKFWEKKYKRELKKHNNL